MFNAEATAHLARAAKLESSADVKKFGRSVRASVRQYLIDATDPQPSEHRAAIASLARSVRDALDGKPGGLEAAAAALEALPPATRRMFEDVAYPRSVPTVRDLRDPVRGRKALSLLYGMCHRGAEWKPGRKRPEGKRSRPRFEPILIKTGARRGRPPNRAEFMLCTYLGGTYYKATGKMPSRTADARNPGPFVRLVGGVLKLLGAPDVNAAELVEAYGAYRRK